MPRELPSLSSQLAHIKEVGFGISAKWSTARLLLSGATHWSWMQPGCRERVEAKCRQVCLLLPALSSDPVEAARSPRLVCRQGWRQLHQLSAHGFFGA